MQALCVSLTSSVLAAEIGEAPDIAQPDGIAHAGQQEVKSPLPGTPVWDLLLLFGAHSFGGDGL